MSAFKKPVFCYALLWQLQYAHLFGHTTASSVKVCIFCSFTSTITLIHVEVLILCVLIFTECCCWIIIWLSSTNNDRIRCSWRRQRKAICSILCVMDDLRFQRPPDGNPYEIRFLHIPGALFCCLWTHTECTNVHSNCHLQVPCDTFQMVETTD
ncbi:uncharacterized protein [Triticum aestivum]|uniref:uncharacterized protein n=1 Tax=Triticum aestivum TaxID=4565 RepID=UPI001D0176FF|nr:uncharacterized protein LOC123134699 [Triticum aestivum]XP_044409831.1 uncharacterized protein LOC123134699 [Triticum aestivum]